MTKAQRGCEKKRISYRAEIKETDGKIRDSFEKATCGIVFLCRITQCFDFATEAASQDKRNTAIALCNCSRSRIINSPDEDPRLWEYPDQYAVRPVIFGNFPSPWTVLITQKAIQE
ncbi:hypothetical protein CBL_00961 [Carabus blaptoides fortunei]